MASWMSYQGGWAWGNRLLTLIVPLIMVPLGFLALRRAWHKIALGAVLLASFYTGRLVYQHTSEYFLILLRQRNVQTNAYRCPHSFSVTYACFSSSWRASRAATPCNPSACRPTGRLWTLRIRDLPGTPSLVRALGSTLQNPSQPLHIPLLIVLGITLRRTFSNLKTNTARKSWNKHRTNPA